MDYSVIIPARNEEKNIYWCLDSLANQTMLPKIVCIINDGSLDNTKQEIINFHCNTGKNFNIQIIDLPKRERSLLGTPEIAKVFNMGFKEVRNNKYRFILIVGADTLLTNDYVENILFEFAHNSRLVVCSGITDEHQINREHVEGSGRMIEKNFFEEYGFKYPINHGWESEILHFARMLGLNAYNIPDAKFTGFRKASSNLKTFYYYGQGMRALGYWTPYAMGRALYKFMIKQKRIRGGIQLIAGYLSFNTIHCDKYLKKFVRRYQITKIKKVFDLEDFLEKHFPNFYYGEYLYNKEEK
jgi:glycosyltransferase involved in cell wall biosynthesis